MPFDASITATVKTLQNSLTLNIERFRESQQAVENAQLEINPDNLEEIVAENADYVYDVDIMYNSSMNKIEMMLEEIHLSNQLATIYSNANIIKNSIDTYDQSTSGIHSLKTLSIALEKCEADFSTNCDRRKVINMTKEDFSKKQEAFEKDYLNYKAKLAKLEEESTSIDKKPAISPISSNNQQRYIKLPELKLPIFDGTYTQWMSFKAQFESRVLQHVTNNSDRLEYLKGSLTGKAALTIKGLEGRDEDFTIAWRLLKETYQNEKIIINSHLQQIDNLKMPESESASSLQKFIDTFLCHYEALKAMDTPVEHWDIIFIYILSKKLDLATRKEIEVKSPQNHVLTLDEFINILKVRRSILETLANTSSKVKPKSFSGNHPASLSSVALSSNTCPSCNMLHAIYQCPIFQKLTPEERCNLVKNKKMCYNCLRTNHQIRNCLAAGCKICNRKHNTLLHINKTKEPITCSSTSSTSAPEVQQVSQTTESKSTSCSSSLVSQKQNSHIWLATALVDIEDQFGNFQTYRCLLDSGSQSNFLTTTARQQLGVKTIKINTTVSGIHESNTNIRQKACVKIKSKCTSFNIHLDCLVIEKITGLIPTHKIEFANLSKPNNIQLADPNFNCPGKIDLLIGAEYYHNIIKENIIRQSIHFPALRNSEFGYIVFGSTIIPQTTINHCHLSTDDNLDQLLQQFWRIENCESQGKLLSVEETYCEEHFKNTYKRDKDGKFIVKLPTKPNIKNLGNSKETALRRFLSLETKLQRDNELKLQYISFMDEYQSLGHMRELTIDELKPQYFIPHHAVVKPDAVTTKCRVVFDGSAKSSSGISINDALMVGPKVQQDLISIMLRFRQHKYVFTSDIKKMYRQIWIDKSQQSLQQIYWRSSHEEEIKTFSLQTVTYGLACSSFLATRVLKQLAVDENNRFPEAARIIERDFYVDDLMTGTDDLNQAIVLKEEVEKLCRLGGFELHKWNANNKKLIINQEEKSIDMSMKESPHIKALGLIWNPCDDVFKYKFQSTSNIITKRSILSAIAKLFDPIGLLGPVILIAKLIMRDLWKLKIDWDEKLPLDIIKKWLVFQNQMCDIQKLNIKRLVVPAIPYKYIELHGFSDGSEAAYGAAVYIRTTDDQGTHYSQLLCSKSKVAPVKSQTIPRIELCGALLLANLVDIVKSSMEIKFNNIYMWTDSTIVLCWLKMESSNLKQFVANRIAKLQSLTKDAEWRHVGSKANPADLVSRGLLPNDLRENQLWWNGPDFLNREKEFWPKSPMNIHLPDQKEIKQKTITMPTTYHSREADNIIERFSCLTKLQRTTAFILRFIDKLKNRLRERRNKTNSRVAEIPPLNVCEIKKANSCLIKLIQSACFHKEIQQLSSTATHRPTVDRKSVLFLLHPYLDEEKILRVGGRLEKAQFPYDKKHQIILPAKHHFTRLVFEYYHSINLHVGPQGLLAAVRQQYWPIRGIDIAKSVYQHCITCFRNKPKGISNLMGNLPPARLKFERPFLVTGVDYAGPIMVKRIYGRSPILDKAYIALFICMSTKAVHLELVSSLSTAGFIAAFQRFIGRRGKPSDVFSDNGSNFKGANHHLKELHKMLYDQRNQTQIIDNTSHKGIKWHFIPAYSPNFGTLWESSVKSVKWHLYRILGKSHLTFEELSTILVQIEAVINSRPLTPISDSPDDMGVLTAGHFLIGASLNDIPEPDVTQHNYNRLSRWNRVTQLKQHFWKRFSDEYLTSLQKRYKWNKQNNNIAIGTLVLLRDEKLPPLHWSRGKITQLYPGADGIVRVCDIKTSHGIVRRAISKICPLPLENIEDKSSTPGVMDK